MVETLTENKIQYGIKNVHWHKVTDTGTELKIDAGQPWVGATEIELDPNGDMVKVYADDQVYYSASNNQGYEGKLSMYSFPLEFEKYALGAVVDDNGIVNESITSKPQAVALSFEFDGDKKATRHVLYNVSFSRPKIQSETKNEKAEPKAQELEFNANPNIYTGNVKGKTSPTTPVAIYDDWFNTVGIVTTKTVASK
ncbi:major tail protein [Companilactobacillus metriopterae]|uniref:major tail protein n=1 Tax=Companilactobacillus metriopterae TaxID=1909267 RepID=UPI0019D70725|nr:major tail protein [Companilactobacillus metriopterae]